MAATRVQVEVDGRILRLSNLDKVMYPAPGFTKGQLIDYYTRVAPYVLPHLSGRPLTLKRYPDGVDGQHFYEKQCPSHRPDWVRTERIVARSKEIDFCVCDDLATLVWAANLADLEQLGLECFPKTSGSKGLQVYVPLNIEGISYDDTKPLAHALARHLESQHPELVVSSMKKELRGGKVLIDWSQNDEHKTTVCVYSLRARERPTVSTPVDWQEVEAALAERDPDALVFEADEVLDRAGERGDLFGPVLRLEQELPEL